MKLTISENFRAVFYAPFYAAFALEAFQAEGVDAVLGGATEHSGASNAIRSGQAQVTWGGPMRVMLDHDRHPDSDIVCFCEVVGRDPFTLVGARPEPGFALADLFSRRLAVVSEVGTPWLCLQHDLRRAGLDPEKLARVDDRTMAENAEALRRGALDVIQVFEPFVETLVAEGAGHVLYAAAQRGPCSYTSFYATRGFLEDNPDAASALARAIQRMQNWIAANDTAALAELVRPYFPDLPMPILTGALSRYRENGVWKSDPVMSREAFDRLADGLVSGGLISGRVPFEDCVDMRFAMAAREAAAGNPPG